MLDTVENQSYYRVWEDSSCNIEIADRYLVVNCTGLCVLPFPFTNHSAFGRRDYYLIYMYKGTMDIFVDGKMREINAGEALIYKPNSEYKYTNSDRGKVVYFWAHFTGYGVKELLKGCKLKSATIFNIGLNREIIASFHKMFMEFVRRDYCFEIAASSHLISICTNLGRSLESLSTINIANKRDIHDSIQFIHRNYHTDIRLKDLASMEHLSISRYRTIFRECTGFSPKSYIINLRIKRACELLSQTDLTIREVAKAVGYQDQLYFSRIFKSRVGTTANSYKQNYSSQKP
ncbi:MAG: AraC family transcriptional regulator [Clostridiales bacterium]|nr:AraC family transcriptional regulator [Clostridiales bacterium]